MQLSYECIDVFYSLGNLRTSGPILVPGMVHIGVVKSNEVRALFFRQLEPGKHLVDTLLVRKFIVKVQIVAGADIFNSGL